MHNPRNCLPNHTQKQSGLSLGNFHGENWWRGNVGGGDFEFRFQNQNVGEWNTLEKIVKDTGKMGMHHWYEWIEAVEIENNFIVFNLRTIPAVKTKTIEDLKQTWDPFPKCHRDLFPIQGIQDNLTIVGQIGYEISCSEAMVAGRHQFRHKDSKIQRTFSKKQWCCICLAVGKQVISDERHNPDENGLDSTLWSTDSFLYFWKHATKNRRPPMRKSLFVCNTDRTSLMPNPQPV